MKNIKNNWIENLLRKLKVDKKNEMRVRDKVSSKERNDIERDSINLDCTSASELPRRNPM